MSRGFELIRQVNAAARRTGAAEHILQFENLATHAQYRVPYEKTAKHLEPGKHVLDWGCGNGHFSLLLQALGARITGYSFEPRPKSLDGSPDFTFVPGNESEPRLLPFPDASFDAAVSVGVLEHVCETGGDERVSLAELARVTRRGGLFFTYHLPNRGGWIENVGRALRMKKYFHPRRYGRDEIVALWNEAGFDILDIGVYDALPRAELRRLPGFLRHSAAFTEAYGALDELIVRLAPGICTTFYIVARRRG